MQESPTASTPDAAGLCVQVGDHVEILRGPRKGSVGTVTATAPENVIHVLLLADAFGGPDLLAIRSGSVRVQRSPRGLKRLLRRAISSK